jgi:hypothetical protein
MSALYQSSAGTLGGVPSFLGGSPKPFTGRDKLPPPSFSKFAERMSDCSAPQIARRLCRAGQRSPERAKVISVAEAVSGSRPLNEAREDSDAPAAHSPDASGNRAEQGAPVEPVESRRLFFEPPSNLQMHGPATRRFQRWLRNSVPSISSTSVPRSLQVLGTTFLRLRCSDQACCDARRHLYRLKAKHRRLLSQSLRHVRLAQGTCSVANEHRRGDAVCRATRRAETWPI